MTDEEAKAEYTAMVDCATRNGVQYTKTTKPGTDGKTPGTGDNSRIGIWITVMVLSAVGIGAVIDVKRKKQK